MLNGVLLEEIIQKIATYFHNSPGSYFYIRILAYL